MKKNSLFIIICTLGGIAAAVTSCQETLEERAAREARQYTKKNCPMRIDDNTVMDSMSFVPASADQQPTICYWYTVSGVADREYTDAEQQQAHDILKQNLNNNTSLKDYRHEGYAFRYAYRSASTPSLIRLDLLYK